MLLHEVRRPADRGGVTAHAFSGIFPVVRALLQAGAEVAVHDLMFHEAEPARYGLIAYKLGDPVDAAGSPGQRL